MVQDIPNNITCSKYKISEHEKLPKDLSVKDILVRSSNIGTTITALLAAITGTVSALVAAFSHLLFNILGILVIYKTPFLRNIPLGCAEYISEIAVSKKYIPLVYLFIIFILIPLCIIYFGR